MKALSILLTMCCIVILGLVTSVHAQTYDVTYVYNASYPSNASSFQSYLAAQGVRCNTITITQAESFGFSQSGVIVICSGSGSVSAAARSNIVNSGRPIVGLGEGGYYFLGAIGLSIGSPHGWHGFWGSAPGHTQIQAVFDRPGAFSSPYSLNVQQGGVLTVCTSSEHVGLYGPGLSPSVYYIGREVGSDNLHYTVCGQGNRIFWGFGGPATYMTTTGRQLFINVLNLLAPMPVHGCSGSLAGIVRNATTGAALSGASISATGTSSGTCRNMRTGADGHYTIANLPADQYNLQANLTPGYAGATGSRNVACTSVDWSPQLQPVAPYDLSIDWVKAYQTLKFEQPLPLVAGKTTVVIADLEPVTAPVLGVSGELIWYDHNVPMNASNPIMNEIEGVCAPITVKLRQQRTTMDTMTWKDALYFPVEGIPASSDIRFEVRAKQYGIVRATRSSSQYSFTAVQGVRLVFVPVFTLEYFGESYVESCRQFVLGVEQRLRSMLPFGRRDLDLMFSPIPVYIPYPAIFLGAGQAAMLELCGCAMLNGNQRTLYVGIFPFNTLNPLPDQLLRGMSGRRGGDQLSSALARCMVVTDGWHPSDPTNAIIVAHEMGHSLAGLYTDRELYAPGGCSASSDPCHLDYWGLNPAYSSNCRTDHTGIPEGPGSHDFMTDDMGCEDWLRWNPTYLQFSNVAHGLTTHSQNGNPSLDASGPYSVISGIVARDSTALMFEIENQTGEYTPVEPDSGGYRLDWLNWEGTEVVKSLWFDPVFERREGLLDYANFFIVTAQPENGAIVTLNVGDHEVARITQSGHAPTAQLLFPNSGTLGDSAIVTWTASDLDGDTLRYDVYANRDGGNWEPLAMGIRDTFMTWHTSYFPGTNAGRVKVVASDGWNIASDSSAGTFVIPMHEPEVFIESPQDTAVILSSGYVTLSGRASDLEDGNIGYDSLAWYADANFLGTGSMIQASNLAAGLRTIMLIATDSDGQTGSAQAYVNVLADLDGDNMSDAWEITHGLDTTVNDGYGDLDRDDLTNLREYQLGTWPDSGDTDHDTYSDGYEISQGSDPKNAASIPGTPMISTPAPVSPTGTLAYGQEVFFTWMASTAADSLLPLRYEVNFDPDSSFSNPITLYADTMISIACPYDLAAGLPYYWKVKVSDIYGHWIWSAKASFTRGYNPIIPERVESLVVRVMSDGLHLYWNPVTRDTSGNPLTGIQYVVYAAPGFDEQFQPIAYTSQTEWTDTEVDSLQWNTWFYRVKAMAEGNPPALISRRNWARTMTQ